ncbi:hypothetical protein LTR47_005964 [Exophiala xenobiotica]|nr:hypothetical protein LTR92_010191 [Exophiala xenobiotica]KAK5207807.1 hypothetical protein LTR41_006319 [Exophiala xenobiotica]KAK5219883.1 hypothetical protein LTR72_007414 [Exophiala xenobiotica]KAK5233100.1 hypothetical protein LTR47_005964 [Exophiala xenobiotica]KAK5247504.1 hypothetical protein LTS06_007309 [Exophiala xenobiotica]
MSVKDRVAIITGAGGGLGRLYALELAKRGAKVVVNDYGGTLDGQAGTSARAESVVDEIRAAGGIAIPDAHDIAAQGSAQAIVAATVKEFGTVDILVNNAGISGKMSPHDNVDAAAFMRVLEIAVLGTSLMTSACYSYMAKQGYGRIINTSSNSIYGFGAGGDCAYGASKAAVFAITRELGRWALRDGIKINCVMPSAASRMGDLSEGTKKVTRTYFPPEGVVPFVVTLASDECPSSGEVFTASANRAARETFATFPGLKSETSEGFLENWDKVMGDSDAPFLAENTLDHVKYIVRQAHGLEMEDMEEFSIVSR